MLMPIGENLQLPMVSGYRFHGELLQEDKGETPREPEKGEG